MRTTGRTRHATTQRRKLVWADSQGAISPLGVAPAGFLNNCLQGYAAAGGSRAGMTVMRIHATFGVNYTPTTAVGTAEGIDVGFVIEDDSSVATELHTNKLYLDWMLLKTVYAAQPGAITTGGGTPSLTTTFELDLRAKRKCQELNQTLWLVLGARTGTVTGVNFHIRTLIALP